MANIFQISFIVLTLCTYFNSGLKLPDYIKACSKSDKNLNECAQKNGQAALASIIKGDSKYHIPKLNPLTIPEIVIDSNGRLTLRLIDALVNGLEKAEIKKINLDLDNHIVNAAIRIPKLVIKAKYDIKGQILVLPINGKGPILIQADEGLYRVNFNYTLYNKNGKEHGRIEHSNVDYDIGKATFKLDNLFDGNKELSDNMNRVLNENWRDVLKDIGPAITEAVRGIIESIFGAVLTKVPYDEVFLQ